MSPCFPRWSAARLWSVLAAACVLTLAGLASPAAAQKAAPKAGAQNQEESLRPEPIQGTVAEVIRKGKATSLKILSEAGGDPIVVAVTPQIQFAVEAPGDSGFLREKQTVHGKGVITNELLFVKDWTVHVGPLARRMKPGLQQAERAIGASVNTYEVLGQVISRQQDKDYPDYETLKLNVAQLRGKPVYIEKEATVTVSTTETDRITEGAACEYFQQPGPGGRFKIVALKVKLKDELKADEFFAAEDDKKK